MKSHPMIFTGESVRAIQAGTKTMTRRVIKPQPKIVFNIQDNLIRVDFKNDDNNWSYAEANPNCSERGLHGRGRWEYLLTNEICWLWEKGLRGVVCVGGVQRGRRIQNCIFVPSKQKEDGAYTQINMHGVSRPSTKEIEPSQTFRWEQGKQQAGKFNVGEPIRELDGQEKAQQALREFYLQVYSRRERKNSVGNKKQPMQSEACSEYFRCFPKLNIRNRKLRTGSYAWVKETHLIVGGKDCEPRIVYKASNTGPDACASPVWRSPIFMPRWASRITLEIIDRRIERLQEISDEDAKAEGVLSIQSTTKGMEKIPYYRSIYKPQELFRMLWDHINGKRYPWKTSPWVWVIEFKRVTD